jgi:hypothetical protein
MSPQSAANASGCDLLRFETYPNWTSPGEELYVDPSRRPTGAAVDRFEYGFGTFLLLVGFAWFAVEKKFRSSDAGPHRHRLEVRPLVPLFVTHFGGFLYLQAGPLSFFSAPNVYPCFLTITIPLLIPPLLVLPLFQRLMTFYRSSVLTSTVANADVGGLMSGGGGGGALLNRHGSMRSDHSGSSTSNSNAEIEFSWKSIFRAAVNVRGSLHPAGKGRGGDGNKRLVPASDAPAEASTVSLPISTAAADFAPATPLVKNQSSAQIDVGRIRSYRFLTSDFFTSITLGLYMVPYLIAAIVLTATDPMITNGCPNGCFATDIGNALVIAGCIIALVCLLVAVYLVRNLSDPFGIVRENTLACLLGGLPAVIATGLGNNTSAAPDFNCQQITCAGVLVLCFVQSWLQIALMYADREKYRTMLLQQGGGETMRSQHHISTSSELYSAMTQVLVDPQLHQLFEQHLIAEHGVESLRFYDAATRWKRDFADVPQRTAESRAKKLCGIYIGDKAMFPVNLPSDVVDRISDALANTGTKALSRDVFDDAIAGVKELMLFDTYLRFARSDLYIKYKKAHPASSARPSMM